MKQNAEKIARKAGKKAKFKCPECGATFYSRTWYPRCLKCDYHKPLRAGIGEVVNYPVIA